MARERSGSGTPMEAVISIIGPGMKVIGDCHTDGTIRIEGSVEGSVTAGKAVVVGKDGLVDGHITTQDAVISGTVKGTLMADSRLELQATCRVEGEVRARRMQLEEGAVLNGTITMGGTTSPAGTPNPVASDTGKPTGDGATTEVAGPEASDPDGSDPDGSDPDATGPDGGAPDGVPAAAEPRQ